MKKHFSLFILLFCCLPLFAQSNNNEDEVVKIDRINYGAYREGEVIVKFKETALPLCVPRAVHVSRRHKQQP